jgi:hypothetical protein
VIDEFDGYGMLPAAYGRSLRVLALKLCAWRDYAQKVADGEWLTEEEQNEIHTVGLWLLGFFSRGVTEKAGLLVADVARDSNTGLVLHEGSGLFHPLIVVDTPPGGEPAGGHRFRV